MDEQKFNHLMQVSTVTNIIKHFNHRFFYLFLTTLRKFKTSQNVVGNPIWEKLAVWKTFREKEMTC